MHADTKKTQLQVVVINMQEIHREMVSTNASV
jgi:hypothetical protein